MIVNNMVSGEMRKVLVVFSFSILFFSKFLFSQTEKLHYSVFYHWGPVWIKGGSLHLSSEEFADERDTLIKLTGKGISSSKWKWLFEIDDTYTSVCRKEDYRPISSMKDAYEAGEKTDNRYLFDYDKSVVYIQTKTNDKPVRYDTLQLSLPLYDAQCATGYLRFMDVSNYKNGDTIKLNLLLDGELVNQSFIIQKNQIIRDKKDRRYDVLLFSAVVKENTLFSSKEAIRVWVTDDKKRIPLKIKADLVVGSVEILYNGIKFKKLQ